MIRTKKHATISKHRLHHFTARVRMIGPNPNAESHGPNSPEWKSSNIAAIAFFYSAITSTFYQTLAIAACRFLLPRSRPLACMGYGVDGVQASSRPFSANIVQIHFDVRLHSLRCKKKKFQGVPSLNKPRNEVYILQRSYL